MSTGFKDWASQVPSRRKKSLLGPEERRIRIGCFCSSHLCLIFLLFLFSFLTLFFLHLALILKLRCRL